MTIKEVEEATGLSRSNIRFYEKEKLLEPLRNENNGYREYTQKDVEDLKKIAYLRTLGISVDDIRKIKEDKYSLLKVLERQQHTLDENMAEIQKARRLCEQMIQEKEKSFDSLTVEKYTGSVNIYMRDNRQKIKMDAVSYVIIWGGTAVWTIITALCFLIAVFSISRLPAKIPIQWSKGEVTSTAGKYIIFLYAAACILIRFCLRPFIWRTMTRIFGCSFDYITDYIVNALCFVVLSVQIFTLLFIAGILKNVMWILLLDGVVFLILFLSAFRQLRSKTST